MCTNKAKSTAAVYIHFWNKSAPGMDLAQHGKGYRVNKSWDAVRIESAVNGQIQV